MLMTSLPLVALVTTVSGVSGSAALPRSRATWRDPGAGQIADRDGVGAAQGREVDLLDAVEVHRDVGDVAGEAHATAVGRDDRFSRLMLAPLNCSVSVPA